MARLVIAASSSGENVSLTVVTITSGSGELGLEPLDLRCKFLDRMTDISTGIISMR